MGVHQSTVSSKVINATTVGGSAEATVVVSPPINLPLDNALVIILWEVVITYGAAQTQCFYVLRRGTTSGGTQVNGGSPITIVASTTVRMTGLYFDTPGVVAGQQYNVGANANGAGGVGSVQDVSITVLAP